MSILETIADVSSTGSFLVGSAPQVITLLRDTLQGPDLQEAVEIAAFILETLVECQQWFTVSEMDEIIDIYSTLKNGIMEIVRAEKNKATKPENEQASKPERRPAFQSTFKRIIKFFKTNKAAAIALLSQPSDEVRVLLDMAAAGKLRTMNLSEKAKYRAVAKARIARAAKDGGAGTLYSECAFTSSKISLLFRQEEALPAWNLNAATQVPLKPRQPPAESTGNDPFASPDDR